MARPELPCRGQAEGAPRLAGDRPVVSTTGYPSPSTRRMFPSLAPHSCAALFAIASSTGCRSVGELLITRRISLVAVCCSRAIGEGLVALLQLLEQPRVLDRDYGLIGEGLEQRDLLSENVAGSAATDADSSYRVAVAKHRHGHEAAISGRLSQTLQAIFRILANIRDIDDGSGEDGAGSRTAAARRHRVCCDGCLERFRTDSLSAAASGCSSPSNV